MPVLNSYDLAYLRKEGHRCSIYASFLKPLTLWTARVNSGSLVRSDTSIPFDTGTGLDFTAIEAYQQVWVGTSSGGNELGALRIKSITSGDSGVTGTVVVAPNNVIWVDDLYLTFKHNYPYEPMYPYIDANEVFYKDRTITYSDQNEEPTPVVVANFSHRADFIENGSAAFWVDLSDSYAVTESATISTYGLSVYPTTGVTVTFDTGTGIGNIIVTSLTQEYYWCKCTVTDSNAKSQSSWRCIFAHNPDRTGSTFPNIDFTVKTLDNDWEGGGAEASLEFHDSVSLTDIPDKTFAVLWKKPLYGLDMEDPVRFKAGSLLFVNPRVSYTVAPGSPCTVSVTFHAGVMLYGQPAPNGTNVTIDIAVSGALLQSGLNNTTTNGQITISSSSFTGADCSGTITVDDNGPYGTIMTQAYIQGQVVSQTSDYPSLLWTFPKTMIAGYVRREDLLHDISGEAGHGQDTIDIATVDDLMRNDFMFSISLAARPTGTISKWYEYEQWLTIGRAVHHIWKWHSTLFEVADVIGLLDNTDGRAYAEFEDGTLYSMPDNMARSAGIRAHIVTSPQGQVHLVQDAQLLTDTDRAALDTVANVTYADRSGEIRIKREPIDRVAFVYGSGLAFNESFSVDDTGQNMPDVLAYCAVAPGAIPSGEGESTYNLERQVLVSQDQLNQLVGRVYAQQNNLYPEVSLTYHGDYTDVLAPHIAEFWEIDVATGDTIKELAIPDLKLIVRNVSADVDVAKGIIVTNVTFEPEMDADIGVTTECPGLPQLPGVEIPPAVALLPGAIVTGSSVWRLPPNSSDWTELTSESVSDLRQDPWWRIRQGSTASSDAILIRTGVGYVKRSTDGGDNWSTITPGTDPPNNASDSPAPTAATVNYHAIEGSYVTQGTFVILARWQNSSNVWRSWLCKTTNDGTSWSWESVGVVEPSNTIDSFGTPVELTSTTEAFDLFGDSTGASYVKAFARLTPTRGVAMVHFIDDGVNPEFPFKAFLLDISGDTVTVSDSELIDDNSGGNLFSFHMVALDSYRFVIAFSGYDDDTGFFTVRARAGYVVGASIYFGDTVVIDSDSSSWQSSICAIDQDHVVVGWMNTSNGVYTSYLYVTDLGAITVVSTDQVTTDTSWGMIDLCNLAYNSFLITYHTTAATNVYGVVGVLGVGGSPTFGTEVALSHGTVSSGDPIQVQRVNAERFLIAYDISSTAYVRMGSIANDDEITMSTQQTAPVWWVAEQFSMLDEEHFIQAAWSLNSYDAFYIATLNLSTGAISWGSEYNRDYELADTLNQIGVYALSSSKAICIDLVDGDVYSEAYAYTINIDNTPSYIAKGLGISLGKAIGDSIWVTYWDGTYLRLAAHLMADLSHVIQIPLGEATEGEVNAYTWIAYPFAPWGYDSVVYVYGRMDNPQLLGSPTHLFTYFFPSWVTAVEQSFGSDHIGALYYTPGGYTFAVRNISSNPPKLYWDDGGSGALTLLSTADMDYGVDPHGIAVDWTTAAVILCSRTADAIMVVRSPYPYTTWVDITSDHGTSAGIDSVEIL